MVAVGRSPAHDLPSQFFSPLRMVSRTSWIVFFLCSLSRLVLLPMESALVWILLWIIFFSSIVAGVVQWQKRWERESMFDEWCRHEWYGHVGSG